MLLKPWEHSARALIWMTLCVVSPLSPEISSLLRYSAQALATAPQMLVRMRKYSKAYIVNPRSACCNQPALFDTHTCTDESWLRLTSSVVLLGMAALGAAGTAGACLGGLRRRAGACLAEICLFWQPVTPMQKAPMPTHARCASHETAEEFGKEQSALQI